MQTPKLYRIRDFGEKINATFEFIRAHILDLLKVVLLIVVPLGLLTGIFFSGIFSTISQVTVTPQMNET